MGGEGKASSGVNTAGHDGEIVLEGRGVIMKNGYGTQIMKISGTSSAVDLCTINCYSPIIGSSGHLYFGLRSQSHTYNRPRRGGSGTHLPGLNTTLRGQDAYYPTGGNGSGQGGDLLIESGLGSWNQSGWSANRGDVVIKGKNITIDVNPYLGNNDWQYCTINGPLIINENQSNHNIPNLCKINGSLTVTGTITGDLAGTATAATTATTATPATNVQVTNSQSDSYFDMLFRGSGSQTALYRSTLHNIQMKPGSSALGGDGALRVSGTTESTHLKISGQPNAATGADAATHEVLVRDTGTGEVKSSAYTDVCFLPGTKITLFDKIRINIENLQKGDSLLSYKLEDMDPLYKSVDVLSWFSEDDTGEFIESIVENIWTDKSPGYIILNDNLHVTHEHLIFTQVDDEFTWLSAKNIRKGDIVFTDKGEYEEIKKIKKVKEEVTVYNLRVRSDAMNYFADSYLVHNASLCDECAGKKGL